MSCPTCGAPDYSQEFSPAFAGAADEPAQDEGWMCGVCGERYHEDEGLRADYQRECAMDDQ